MNLSAFLNLIATALHSPEVAHAAKSLIDAEGAALVAAFPALKGTIGDLISRVDAIIDGQ